MHIFRKNAAFDRGRVHHDQAAYGDLYHHCCRLRGPWDPYGPRKPAIRSAVPAARWLGQVQRGRLRQGRQTICDAVARPPTTCPRTFLPQVITDFCLLVSRTIIITGQTPRLDLERGGESPRPVRGVNRPPRAVTRCRQTSSPGWPRAFNVFPAKVRKIGQDPRYQSPCTAYRRRMGSAVGYRGRVGPAHPRDGKSGGRKWRYFRWPIFHFYRRVARRKLIFYTSRAGRHVLIVVPVPYHP